MKLPKLTFSKKRRNKRPPSQTPNAEIFTMEDLFTLISETKQDIKETRKSGVKVEFDVDSDADVGADGIAPEEQGDNSDIISISTFSTMATMDDNIGAGRTMDNHFYQPVGRFIEKVVMFLAFLLHVSQGGGVRTPFPVPDPASDGASLVSSVSSTSTATDLPGTGRIIDKYIYQILGGMIERCMGRIAMSHFLSSWDIYIRIELLWYNVEVKEPCFVCRLLKEYRMTAAEQVRMAVKHIEDAPSGMFILAGMKELTKRLRSKFLYRRVEARTVCEALFNLDALHVLGDSKDLRSALRENILMEDAKKLTLRLSTRAEKLKKKGKELPVQQIQLLDVIGARFDDRLLLSGKPRMGNDMLPLLLELLVWHKLTNVQILQRQYLCEAMIDQCLNHFSPYLARDVPCQKLTEVLEALYLTLASRSVLQCATIQGAVKSASKRQNVFDVHWPKIMKIIKFVMQSYAVPGCQECGPLCTVRPCLCLDRIVVLWRIVYLFMDDEVCVYENVLREANSLCGDLFVKCFEILRDTSERPDTSSERVDRAVQRLFNEIAFAGEAQARSLNYLRFAVSDASNAQMCGHGVRYKGLIKDSDFWDENRLQLLKDNKRRRHGHVAAKGIAAALEEIRIGQRKSVKDLIEQIKSKLPKRNNVPLDQVNI